MIFANVIDKVNHKLIDITNYKVDKLLFILGKIILKLFKQNG